MLATNVVAKKVRDYGSAAIFIVFRPSGTQRGLFDIMQGIAAIRTCRASLVTLPLSRDD